MALAGLLIFVAGLTLGPMQETDLFFRLASGEAFLRTGALVHRNLFSFTYPETPYEDSAWLFDVGAAASYRLGGFPAVVVAKTLLVLAITLVAYRTCRRRGASALGATFCLALAAWCMRERLVERPHLFSLLGEAALFALLPSILRGGWRSWIVLPLVALWTNLHAGAFLAVVFLGLLALGTWLDGKDRKTILRLFALALGAGAALLLSPVGAGILTYLSFHTGIFSVHAVDEFRSVTWRSDAPFLLFAAAALGLLYLKTAWQARLPALGFTVLALWHVRFTADALLVLALTSAPALSRLADRVPILRRPLTNELLATLLAAWALLPRIVDVAQGRPFLALGLDKSSLPLDALTFVEEHGLRERMYNDFETGSYLLWQGYPRYRVFVDPRLPAYPMEFHRLLGRMDLSRPEWTQAMEQLGVASALLDYAGINRRAAYWDPETWALVFRAKDSRVFVRRLEKWHDLISAYEIPATFTFTVEDGAKTQPLPTPPSSSPVSACEWQIRLGDLYFDLDNGKSERALLAYRAALAMPASCLAPTREASAAAWIGAIDLGAHDFENALALLDRALAITPDDTAILTNRALALEGRGSSNEARQTWARIAALAAGSALGQRAAEKAAGSR